MQSAGKWLVICVSWAGLAGCAGPRYVLKSPDQGIIAMPSNSNHWPTRYREKAEEMIRMHFPDGFEIEREEEWVIGEVTRGHVADQGHFRALGPSGQVGIVFGGVSSVAETAPQTEWRILYRRKGSPSTTPADGALLVPTSASSPTPKVSVAAPAETVPPRPTTVPSR